MRKAIDEQNIPIKTHAGRDKKHSTSRDMFSTLDNHVVCLKESIREVNETLGVVETYTKELESTKSNLRNM